MKLLFDIETNGLPRQGLDHIHCVVVKDIDTEEVFRFMTLETLTQLLMLLPFSKRLMFLSAITLLALTYRLSKASTLLQPQSHPIRYSDSESDVLSGYPKSGLPQKAHWNAKEAIW
jgi:hypothetical protein